MAFVKHSVNLFLVLLIVVSVSTIAGLTLYYQGTFQKVVGEFDTANDALTTCQSTLTVTKQELANAQVTVSANQEDVEKTVSLFEEKKAELEHLKELRDLSGDVASQMEALENKLSTLTDGTQGMIYAKPVSRLTAY